MIYQHQLKTVVLFFSFLFISNSYSQCNGHPSLCDKRYNEVAYLTTHNAYNSEEDEFTLPNQHYTVSRQLEDGVRGLMLDVYDLDGEVTVYHGMTFLGTEPLITYLNDIKTFLDANPNEIVTIIFETYSTSAAIEGDLTTAGLMDYLYAHETGTEWATLQEMIDANTRLVIFSEQNDGAPDQDWYHYFWENAVETHFSYPSVADFSCDFNRGDASNDLFLINHFVTDAEFGVGIESESEIANSNPLFIDRVQECQMTHGKFPNFLAVDFYDLGNCFEVLNTINDAPGASIAESKIESLALYPNPSSDWIYIEANQNTPVYITNMIGDEVQVTATFSGNRISVDVSTLSSGMYIIRLGDQTGRFTKN